jgi:hypothetical protein
MLNQRTAAHDLALFALVDTTSECDLAPFWADRTTSECSCAKCAQIKLDAYYDLRAEQDHAEWLADQAEDRARWALVAESLMWCPEPPSAITGTIIMVEWECLDYGGRHWVSMDAGELTRECWAMRRVGYGLSDVDEPANVGRPLGHGDEAPEFYL